MAKKVSVMLVTDKLVPKVAKGYWDVDKWSYCCNSTCNSVELQQYPG